MKFKANRDFVLAHMGHVVAFKKGEEKVVPRCMHELALEQGFDAVLDKGEEAPKPPVTTTNDVDRVEEIKAAMRQIKTTNNSADFTAGGAPKVKVLETYTKARTKNGEELLKLWAEVRDEA